MATVNLGRIKPVWQGSWNSSTQYVAEDIVQYNNHAWVATTTNTNSAPADGNSNWDLMARGSVIPSGETNGQLLSGDGSGNLSWADAPTGGVLQIKKAEWTATSSMQSASYVGTGLNINITPTSSTSSFYIDAWINMQPMNHDANAVLNIHDSALGSTYSNTSEFCFTARPDQTTGANKNRGYMNFWSSGADASTDDYRSEMVNVNGLYTPASQSGSARTFTVVVRNHLVTPANGFYFNYGIQDHPHQSTGCSHITVWEVEGNIVG